MRLSSVCGVLECNVRRASRRRRPLAAPSRDASPSSRRRDTQTRVAGGTPQLSARVHTSSPEDAAQSRREDRTGSITAAEPPQTARRTVTSHLTLIPLQYQQDISDKLSLEEERVRRRRMTLPRAHGHATGLAAMDTPTDAPATLLCYVCFV